MKVKLPKFSAVIACRDADDSFANGCVEACRHCFANRFFVDSVDDNFVGALSVLVKF
jgi:hypothetical protein